MSYDTSLFSYIVIFKVNKGKQNMNTSGSCSYLFFSSFHSFRNKVIYYISKSENFNTESLQAYVFHLGKTSKSTPKSDTNDYFVAHASIHMYLLYTKILVPKII